MDEGKEWSHQENSSLEVDKCVVLICLRLAALLSKVGGIIVGR